MSRMKRTWSLLCCAVGIAAMAGPAFAGGGTLQTIGSFSVPTYIAHAPGDDARLYVLERAGRIKLIKDGVTQPGTFLDLSALVSTTFEGGLLGMAFHPDHANNRKFYVSYTAPGGGGAALITTIASYEVSELDPDVADASTVQTIITVDQPASNHNAGWIGFSPLDGYLYIPLGDGGGGQSRSQDITNQLLGKVLRLDIDGDDFPGDPLRNYAIPPTNPYVGVTGDDEIWGLGLRNPYRGSFDRVTGDLWLGDVGGGAFEEVNVQPADDPGPINYGWGCMEGNNCNGGFCTCNDPSLTLPVHAYSHANGCVVTGGAMYRGCALPHFIGTYFFIDYCSDRLWTFEYADGVMSNFTERTSEFPSMNNIVAIGEDNKGELYFVSLSGQIRKLIPTIPGGAQCSVTADLNGDGVVSFADILVLIGAWGPCGVPCPEDLDGNGSVGFSDLLEVIANWT